MGKSVCVFGCGSIGGFLARHILADGAADSIELGYVYDVDEKRVQDIPAAAELPTFRPLHDRPPCSRGRPMPSLLKEVAVRHVERFRFCCCSRSPHWPTMAFARRWEQTAVQVRAEDFLPHGAMIGIDGLADAGPDSQERFTVTTTRVRQPGFPTGQARRWSTRGLSAKPCAKLPECDVHLFHRPGRPGI